MRDSTAAEHNNGVHFELVPTSSADVFDPAAPYLAAASTDVAAQLSLEDAGDSYAPRATTDGANNLSAAAFRKSSKKRGKPEEDVADGGDVTKRRRTWELWSVSDKHIFFEALNEYGKDFDNIQIHFQNKLKNKKNIPADYIKNKNQIRHFYYRSWHKISSYLNFDADLKKNTKELFGLINYGELWKKVGGNLDDKLGAKLDELVQKGTATIKHKGKTFRVKTPVCRALKTIHNKGDTIGRQKGSKLFPAKVEIELKPRETKDWCKVQKLAQNPHVKVSLCLQRRIYSVIKCLSEKWKNRETKALESILSFKDAVSSDDTEELVLFPLKSSKMSLPVITVAPVITSSQISLQSMRQEKPNGAFKPKVQFQLSCDSETIVTESNGNNGHLDALCYTQAQDCDKLCEGLDLEGEEFLLATEGDDSEGDSSRSPGPAPDPGQDKESDIEMENDIEEYDKELEEEEEKEDSEDKEQEDEKEHIIEVDVKEEKPFDDKPNFSNLKAFNCSEGWSLKNSGSVTVGELFFMLAAEGSSKFELEYHWRIVQPDIKCSEPKPQAESDRFPCSKQQRDSQLCHSTLSRLIRLSTCQPCKGGRGRQNSFSTTSPSVRNLLNSPISPVSSRSSPTSRFINRGVAKQLPLVNDQPEKPGSPLAVPLEPEVEFRKPLAPAVKSAVAVMSSSFQQQIGQYFPKFSNRRGRQTRSRAKNPVPGRLQPLLPNQPRQIFQQLVYPSLSVNQALSVANNPIIIETPLILGTNGLQPANLISAPISPIHMPGSPPQISIPYPALSLDTHPPSPSFSEARRSPSPTQTYSVHRRSPSPTPSFSALLDISFPESAPATPSKQDMFSSMMDEGSLLYTPPRSQSPHPTSPSRCLVESSDMSLSSWALHFESPMKQHSISVMHNEDSQASTISTNSEVDRQLTAMMNENSLDFTSTFRALAKHVTSSDQETTHT